MLINESGTQIVSNLGWVDRGGLWVYRLGAGRPRLVPISEAPWLALYPGRNDYFALVHRLGDDLLRLTAHHHDDPSQSVSAIDFTATPSAPGVSSIPDSGSGRLQVGKFSGDPDAWSFLPGAFIGYAVGDYQLLLVDAHTQSAEVQTLAWFDESYDVIYQAITDVMEIAGSRLLCSLHPSRLKPRPLQP
jgi:hypothetical protein